ncbi:hypothetical protein MASR1M45_02160 [Candidatus Kapaibacterium sp.]
MKRKMFLIVAAFVLLFVQSAFAQTEELPDTVWTKFTYPNAINAVKFTPDGKYLASGGDDGIPKLWDVETGELVREFLGNGSKIWSLDINNTGEMIAIVNDFSEIFIWNIVNGDSIRFIDMNPTTKTMGGSLTFSNNGNYLAANLVKNGQEYPERDIYLFDTKNFDVISVYYNLRVATKMSFSPMDNYLAVSNVVSQNRTSILIFKVPTLNPITSVGSIDGGIRQSAFSPNNEYLAGALESSPNKIWNTTDWKLFREFGEMWSNTKAIQISKDNNYVVSGPLVDLKQGALIIINDILAKTTTYSYKLNYYMEYFGHDKGDWAYCLDISNNNNKIAVGTGAGIYMLNAKWNPTSVQDNPVQIFEPLVFPNPTNSTANIRFDLLNSATINIQIYDINSRLIAHIFDGFLESGNHNFEWNTAQAPSGSYFARITANGIISSIQIIVNK